VESLLCHVTYLDWVRCEMELTRPASDWKKESQALDAIEASRRE